MSAGNKNLTIDQGADFFITFVYKDSAGVPINLTGFTANMQLRANYDSALAALSLSTNPSGGITITPTLGQISVRATAAQTGAVPALDYVYDLEITSSGGIVTRLIQGRAVVTPQVTR
jgi:hypothetical protein